MKTSSNWKYATKDELIIEYQKAITTNDYVGGHPTNKELKEYNQDFFKAVQKMGGSKELRSELHLRFAQKMQKELDITMTEMLADITVNVVNDTILPSKLKIGVSYNAKWAERVIDDIVGNNVYWHDEFGSGLCTKQTFCRWIEKNDARPPIVNNDEPSFFDRRSFWKCLKGHNFEATVQARLNAFYKNQEDCPDCIRGSYSKGEDKLYEIVSSIFPGEPIRRGYRPNWLKSSFGGQMHLDVVLVEKKIAFEFQGEQHNKPTDFFGGEEAFKKQVQRDKDKRELCLKNEWRLIEVPYSWYSKGCQKQYIENAVNGS